MGDSKTWLGGLNLPPEDCELLLSRAVDHYGEGAFEDAENILKGLCHLASKDARVFKLRGSILVLLHQHRLAEEVYSTALELEPNDPYTLCALAELKLKGMKVHEAEPLLMKLFELDPEGKHPAANRGRKLVHDFSKKLT